MATTTQRQPQVAAVDDSAAEEAKIGGEGLGAFIDEQSLQAQTEKFAKQNRATTRGFRQYQKKVIEKAQVRNTHQHRQLTSDVCGSVARLSDVPDETEKIRDEFGQETTEYELSVRAIAAFACSNMQGDQVYTVTAQKLARAALDLRKTDPDGKKKIAWVNDQREDEASVLDD